MENFARTQGANRSAHLADAEQFVHYLRALRVTSSGHSHTHRRPLRHKGIRYILETCRSLYGFAAKKRYMPPYAENPLRRARRQAFLDLGFRLIDSRRPLGDPPKLALAVDMV